MNFAAAISTCLGKYFIMSGRASRSEYWWFQLGVLLFTIVTASLDAALTVAASRPPIFDMVGTLLVMCPLLAVAVRRMHDIGRSGRWLFAPLVFAAMGIAFGAIFGKRLGQPASIVAGCIMLFGFLLPLWWYTRPSQPGPNKYGPNPQEVTP